MIKTNQTMRMFKNISMFILCLSVGSAYAQQKVSLSLAEAKEFALNHNKSFLKSQNAVDEAFYSHREAVGTLLPQAKVAADYSNFLGAEMSIAFGPQDMIVPFNPSANLQASVSQILFNGNAIVGTMLANLAKDMSTLNVSSSALTLKKNVSTSYFSVLLSLAMKEVLQDNYKNIKDIYMKTKSMADVGVLEQTDADQLMVQVNMVGNLVRNSDRNVEVSTRYLKILLGLGVEDSVVLTDEISEIISGVNDSDILQSTYNLSADPSFQLAELSEQMANKNLLKSKLNLLPTVSAFYSYTEKVLAPAFDMTPKHVVGISASIPVFTGLTNYSKIKKAQIGLENASLDKDMLRDNLLTQEHQLRSNLSTAIEQYATQKMNISIAERVLNSIQLKFDQGIKSSLDLTTANSNYIQAQSDYLTSMLQLFEARTALEKMLGTL